MYRNLQKDETGRWYYQLDDELSMPMLFPERAHSCSITTPIDMTDADSFRKKLERRMAQVSITSLIIKASANALEDFPILCGKWEERIDRIICPPPGEVNIAGPTNVDGATIGFYIDKANKKSLIEISKELRTQVDYAKNKKMPSPEVIGKFGSTPTMTAFPPMFCISNVGTIGCVESGFGQMRGIFTSMLAICSILEKPVVKDGEIVIRKMMNAVLLWDERAVVADIPVEFLTRLKRNLEDPDTYLV
jgi:pyruvate dehydrogenase E2 component (dihydrolipoamide acetyltransferase)